jgi:uncharacterized membrane protein YkgB
MTTLTNQVRLQIAEMTTVTNQIRLQIAEKSAGSLNFLALLRWALVIVFLWFGGMKFTAYEAAGNAPLIEHSPIMSWLLALFGVQGASSHSRGLSAHFFRIGSGDVRRDLSYHADVLPEHAWYSRSDGGRISGDLGSTGAVPS